MSIGAKLIAEERQRQIEVRGYTDEQNDKLANGELAWTAACYAAPLPIHRPSLSGIDGDYVDPWPGCCTDKRKEGTRIRRLTKAGALVAAEIDRLQRLPNERLSTDETGVELIGAERQRQIEAEGWSASHDDSHSLEELAWAAACYAAPGEVRTLVYGKTTGELLWASDPWPWEAEWDKRGQSPRVRDLVKAGALIAAEIDRLSRLEAEEQPNG